LQSLEKIRTTPVAAVLRIPAILALALLISCHPSPYQTLEKTFILMDTYVSMKIFYTDGMETRWQQVLDQAVERMALIDSVCDVYRSTSDVSRVNARAGAGWTRVSPETAAVLAKALEISRLSAGLFDVSIGVLMQRYGFGRSENLSLPAPAELAGLLGKVDYRAINLQGDSVALRKPGMALDLGGIAKGYAIDEALRVLSAAGVTDAQVDVGGEVATLAGPLTAGKRHIYVRDPRQRERFYGRFRMDQGCVATSGDYERYFMHQGKRFHHILDPRSGLPAWGCRSVTIQAPENSLCDGLSTAVFVAGPQQGMALVESLPGVEAIILYEDDQGLHHKISSGLQKTFQLLSAGE